MFPSRFIHFLRRVSNGDSRIKNNLNISQSQATVKDCHLVLSNKNCEITDIAQSQRCFSSFPQLNICDNNRRLVKSSSDNLYRTMASTSSDSSSSEKPKFTNRLINERSPYLLQHAHNPVDWYPWGPEAIEKAKKDNKLIFLSVGYSTCHWCHVMEKESFENEEVAKIMNAHYVNIKVDREERPDIDKSYMLFVQATTGGGGWPMSVFLTPDLNPVTGGTYFPPDDKYGRRGFKSILSSLAERWNKDPSEFLNAGQHIIDVLKNFSSMQVKESDAGIPGEDTIKKSIEHFTRNFEDDFGGFGDAPKFPQASNFNFLMHVYARNKSNKESKKCLEMCLYTLKKMANGGIHDHISSGFARYSVDRKWHVPHFEKMLYDQAQLAIVYTDAYLATKDDFFADVARDILKYVSRDLSHDLGGFYSAEDADSYPTHGAKDKAEGAFCVWEYSEIESLLGDKILDTGKGAPVTYCDIFCNHFSVKKNGNIERASDPHCELTNKNVLIIYGSLKETAEKFGLDLVKLGQILEKCRQILYDERQNRPRPHLDSKILCSWNGLMIAAFARAGQTLGDKSYIERAIKAANFIKKYLFIEGSGVLLRSCYRNENGGISQISQPINGFLDDYAFLIMGLLDLYESTFEASWLEWALQLQDKQDELFWDSENGAYFSSPVGDPSVILRLKEDQDGAEPSGNSISLHNSLRLSALAPKHDAPTCSRRELAQKLLEAFAEKLRSSPMSLPEMTSALLTYLDSPTQVFIAGASDDPRTLDLLRVVRCRFLPAKIVAVADPAAQPASPGMSEILLSRIQLLGGAPAAYVCRRYACSLPVTEPTKLEQILDE